MSEAKAGAGRATEEDEVPFPAGIPKPHDVEAWARSLKKQFLARGVADVAREVVPEGKFDALYPESMLAPMSKPGKGASWSEEATYRRHLDELEKRKLHNANIMAKRTEWFNDGNNTVFEIVVDTMVHTQPALRKTLKDAHQLEDGRYDGVAAVKDLQEWLKASNDRHPQEDYYDNLMQAIKKKRLPVGASEKAFQTVVRRVRFDINPYTSAPLEGEKLGRYIIQKIMPPYVDAAETLEHRLRTSGKLGDIDEVVSECASTVERRATGTASAHSAIPGEIEAYLASSSPPSDEGILSETAPVIPATLGLTDKKARVDPKKGKFCKRCPHKTRDGKSAPCFANPGIEIKGEKQLKLLARFRSETLEVLDAARTQNAKVLGIKAIPLPSAEELAKHKAKPAGGEEKQDGALAMEQYGETEDDDYFGQIVDIAANFVAIVEEDDAGEPEAPKDQAVEHPPSAAPEVSQADGDMLTMPSEEDEKKSETANAIDTIGKPKSALAITEGLEGITKREAAVSLEILYVRSILTDLGHAFELDPELATKDPEAHRLAHKAIGIIQHGATEVGTDNSGAYNLCHRDSRGKNSRHVERKVFKMRELRHRGIVKLALIGTKDMAADMLTKPLDDKSFQRHRRTVMNCG